MAEPDGARHSDFEQSSGHTPKRTLLILALSAASFLGQVINNTNITRRGNSLVPATSAQGLAPLNDLDQYDCVMIVTDHSDYNYPGIVRKAKLVDTHTVTKEINSSKIVHC
jgi:hypothetical protein